LEILRQVADLLTKLGAKLQNVDCTLIAEVPKIQPHVATMQANLAEALRIPTKRVGVKATTNETMGFVGRREGIAALAVASVRVTENE
jgi:2-C-methyl-D-erythritol 2,4-cyclodiphosphate synthase